MATKSIYKDVHIRNKHLSSALITALEHAKDFRAPEVVLSKSVKTLKKGQIRDAFTKK